MESARSAGSAASKTRGSPLGGIPSGVETSAGSLTPVGGSVDEILSFLLGRQTKRREESRLAQQLEVALAASNEVQRDSVTGQSFLVTRDGSLRLPLSQVLRSGSSLSSALTQNSVAAQREALRNAAGIIKDLGVNFSRLKSGSLQIPDEWKQD